MDFVQAKNYTPTSGRQIDLWVVHDMEAGQGARRAENVAAWFAGSTAPRASAHYCGDQDSIVQSVKDKDVAWHAPGANHNGLGFEHAGFARASREEWLNTENTAMLKLSAALCAEKCKQYAIPMAFVDAVGLLRGERGITTHWEVSRAFHKSDHWDPGTGFPMDLYVQWVIEAAGGAPAPVPTKPPVIVDDGLLSRGDKGQEVKDWQTILKNAGYNIAVDGDFGPATEAATKDFQGKLNVAADGVVGPATREAFARLIAWLAAQAAPKVPQGIPPFPGQVQRGSRGEAVRQVQQRFKDRGWKITVDGDFGPGTDKVVRAFQEEKGLGVDGIVGPKTWNAMWTLPV